MADEDGLFDDSDGGQPVVRRRRGKRRAKLVIAAIFFLLLIAGAVAILVALCVVVGKVRPVQTSCGPVEGLFNTTTGVYSFKGIPFAEPPVGKNRWKAPVALSKDRDTCWHNVLQAKTDPPQCMQQLKPGNVTGFEDCLYLTVHTPGVDARNLRPVMVYIHGGYLQFGNASQHMYTPDGNTAHELGVVFVNIQYRLSAFGFLVLDALPGKGNYGIHDQLEALRWVRENIAQFGGDPDQVTIFGQSSGGTSVWALMMAPSAKGLFHRAWMLSGSPIFNKTLADARLENQEFLTPNAPMYVTCGADPTEECLMNMTAVDVVRSVYPFWDVLADSMDLPDRGVFEPALLIVDGDLIPQAPFDVWDDRSGNYSDVPLIVGTTAQELDLSPTPMNIENWQKDAYDSYIDLKCGPFGPNLTSHVLELYPWEQGDFAAEKLVTTLGTDIRLTCGMHVLSVKAAAAMSSPVYRYIITSAPSSPVHVFNLPFAAKFAFHAWDDFAFMGAVDELMENKAKPADLEFARTLREEMLHFAKTGKPRDPLWKPYPDSTALIAAKMSYVEGEYHSEDCALWDSYGLLNYGWIN